MSLTLRGLVRQGLRRFGFDVVKWNSTFARGRQLMLARHGVNVVLDVGANAGQFANRIFAEGFRGRVVSFEPTSEVFNTLRQRTTANRSWEAVQMALGDHDGRVNINVAGNSAQSSSVLPMLEAHKVALPRAQYVRTEDVEIRRLDSVFERFVRPGERAFLKLDVQGFERQVLAGAERSLPLLAGVQLETQLVPLYEGEWVLDEAMAWMRAQGFVPNDMHPAFSNLQRGELLSLDCTYFRPLA